MSVLDASVYELFDVHIKKKKQGSCRTQVARMQETVMLF